MASLANNRGAGGGRRRGQVLLEALIAVVVAGILIGGAAALMAQSLKSGTANKSAQTAALLAQELTEKTAAHAQQAWNTGSSCTVPGTCGIYNLAKSAHYYLVYDGIEKYTVYGGDENVPQINGVTYTRYFYVENVCRDSGGAVADCTGATEDPSTQRVTAAVSWPGGGPITVSRFLARTANIAIVQTDWSGGGGQADMPAGSVNNQFDTSSEIDFTSVPGVLQVNQ